MTTTRHIPIADLILPDDWTNSDVHTAIIERFGWDWALSHIEADAAGRLVAVATGPDTETRRMAIPAGYDRTRLDHVSQLAAVAPDWTLVDDSNGQATFVRGALTVRKLDLGPEASASHADERLAATIADAYGLGWVLDSFDAIDGLAVVKREALVTTRTRRLVANRMGVCPWQIGIECESDEDGRKSVTLSRLGPLHMDQAKRDKLWDELRLLIGHNGWRARDRAAVGEAVFVRGEPIVLPDRVAVDFSAIPDELTIETSDWGRLPIGVDGRNLPVEIDTSANPHSLVQGGTGAGKSVLLRTLMWGALARGWELAIVDVSKRGLDFRNFKPWVRPGGWGCADHEAALKVIGDVYAEGQRRADLLDSLDTPKWLDLPLEVRRQHGFRPILLVVDEATSLVAVEAPPKGLPKDDPELLAAQALAANQGRILAALRKIARELRFVGVHLVVGTQQYRAEDFGSGALREQLGNRVLLGRASRTAIGMAVMNVEAAVEAVVAAYGSLGSDGDVGSDTKPGRGVAEIEGRGTLPFQSSFAQPGSSTDPGDYARDLERRGIAKTPNAPKLDDEPEVLDTELDFSIDPPDDEAA